MMPKDPTIAIRDCLAEIAILHEIERRMTLQAFRSDPPRSCVRDPDHSPMVKRRITPGHGVARAQPGDDVRSSAEGRWLQGQVTEESAL
jgi:hypothetical protein